MIITATVLFVLSPSVGFTPVSAHTTVNIENIEIDVGWGIEPPVVGIRNDFVFKIVELGEREGAYTGITSAFRNLDATAMYGGATKKVEINSDPRVLSLSSTRRIFNKFKKNTVFLKITNIPKFGIITLESKR